VDLFDPVLRKRPVRACSESVVVFDKSEDLRVNFDLRKSEMVMLAVSSARDEPMDERLYEDVVDGEQAAEESVCTWMFILAEGVSCPKSYVVSLQ